MYVHAYKDPISTAVGMLSLRTRDIYRDARDKTTTRFGGGEKPVWSYQRAIFFSSLSFAHPAVDNVQHFVRLLDVPVF